MNDNKIAEWTEFFFSSDTAEDVPFRLAIIMGMGGADLTPKGLHILLTGLRDLPASKESAKTILERLDNES